MSSLRKSVEQVNGNILGASFKSILVVMDCAKREHIVQFVHPAKQCHMLPHALKIANSEPGMEKLIHQLEKCCKTHKLKFKDATFVIEDLPSYCRNFIHQLQQRDFKVCYVNAQKASHYRSNERASSDELDLDGIARTAILGHIHDADKKKMVLYQALKFAVRERERLIKERTAHECVIHTHIDSLFPGFLDHKKSKISPFAEACIKIMSRKDFSAQSFARKKLPALTTLLDTAGTMEPAKAALKLQQLAKSTLTMDSELVVSMQERLHMNLKIFDARQNAIVAEEKHIASLLAQSPGFYLTSIPGISITLAAKIMAEFSDPAFWKSADKMASYAGVIPRQKQSGGSAKAPVTLSLPKACNRFLKNALMSAVKGCKRFDHPSIAVCGVEHSLKKHFKKIELRGGYSFTSTAKKLLRTIHELVLKEDIYMPRGEDLPPDKFIAWVEMETRAMMTKWATYGVTPSDDNKLGEWLRKKDQILNVLK